MLVKSYVNFFVLVLFGFLLAVTIASEDNIEKSHPSHEKSTDHWAVELNPGVDADQVAKEHGFINMGPVGSLQNVYLFHKRTVSRRDVDIVDGEHPHISTSPHVSWFENQVAKRRFKRWDPPTDPSYSSQWHLKDSNGIDINIEGAWKRGITGSGVTIAMVDDGLQRTHPDISPNYKSDGSYDFNEGDADPYPHYGDDHGTSAGGVAAAKNNNGVCGTGAAPNAGLSGIRLIADYTTDAQEASGLAFKTSLNFIYSNSWGPNDDGRRLEGPGPLTRRAFEDSVTNGRDGKGSIYVWAGGNGRTAGDNCNYDGYANSRFTIAIGAVDFQGRQSYYSESCAALIACAPSSGSSRSITTTDLLGSAGTAYGDCTSSFGGTSAAAPLAAGVVALMLEANPRLGWRDVQHILVNTSRKTDPSDSDWVVNGAGYHVNHKYGFGLMDADAAVSSSITHKNLPAYRSILAPSTTMNKPLQDNTPVESSISITDELIVEHVEVIFTAAHSSRGDLQIVLTSPHGTSSVLQETHNDKTININGWTYVTFRCWGETSVGRWKLTVEDKKAVNTGTWTSWELKIYGHRNE